METMEIELNVTQSRMIILLLNKLSSAMQGERGVEHVNGKEL